MSINEMNKLLEGVAWDEPLPAEYVQRRQKQLAELRKELEGKIDEHEKTGDIREWSRAVRKLLCFFPRTPPERILVNEQFYKDLEVVAKANDDLGKDLWLYEGMLVFRRTPIKVKQ